MRAVKLQFLFVSQLRMFDFILYNSSNFSHFCETTNDLFTRLCPILSCKFIYSLPTKRFSFWIMLHKKVKSCSYLSTKRALAKQSIKRETVWQMLHFGFGFIHYEHWNRQEMARQRRNTQARRRAKEVKNHRCK